MALEPGGTLALEPGGTLALEPGGTLALELWDGLVEEGSNIFVGVIFLEDDRSSLDNGSTFLPSPLTAPSPSSGRK